MTENKRVFEIYTKHPETGERGWSIKQVFATKSGIKSFPNFDCVISVGDMNTRMKTVNWV